MTGNAECGRRRDESGVTYIELGIALLIVAVLIAVAVPTMLNARSTAADRSAQNRVRQALTAQKVHQAANASYASSADLAAEDPTARYSGDALVLGTVYVREPTAAAVEVASQSKTGTCFWIRDSINTGTQYAKTDCPDVPTETDYLKGW